MFLRRIFFAAVLVGTSALFSAPVLAQAAGAKGENFLYRVILNDTLGQLADYYTTSTSNWTRLAELNQVKDPTKLPVGLVLKIPFSLIPVLPSSARVSHLRGHASVNGQTLTTSSLITEGQTIITSPNGFVTLQLQDDSLLSVPASSRLTVTRLRVFKGAGLIDSIINVEEGSLESAVAPKKSGVGRFEVRTPVSVTGVRGTRLRVHVSGAGSRSEVVEGTAAVDAGRAPEATLREKHGMAVSAAGENLGMRALLPAPQLSSPVRGPGGWTVDFPPVAGASAYLVRVATESEGVDLVSSREFASNQVHFNSVGPGTYHVFVRAVDDLGIGGNDGHQSFIGQLVLQRSDATSVLTGSGQPIVVADY